MRHDHTVSCLHSVVAVSTQKMALDTTLLHSDNNPSIPVAFCLESSIQWRQNPAQNLILAWFEEQNKLCAAAREAPSSLYKYTRTNADTDKEHNLPSMEKGLKRNYDTVLYFPFTGT